MFEIRFEPHSLTLAHRCLWHFEFEFRRSRWHQYQCNALTNTTTNAARESARESAAFFDLATIVGFRNSVSFRTQSAADQHRQRCVAARRMRCEFDSKARREQCVALLSARSRTRMRTCRHRRLRPPCSKYLNDFQYGRRCHCLLLLLLLFPCHRCAVVVVAMLASLPAAPCGGTSSDRAYTCYGSHCSMPPAVEWNFTLEYKL